MGVDPISAALNIGGKLIDRLWPDENQRDAAKLELLKLAQQGEFKQIDTELQMAQGQMEINKVEAASDAFLKSGWRPFIGWVCGLGCAWNWVGLPVALFVLSLLGKPVVLKPADLSEMMPLLLGMLGLGGLRTVERLKGKA